MENVSLANPKSVSFNVASSSEREKEFKFKYNIDTVAAVLFMASEHC